mgnify:CR=1 FL=1
MRFIVVDGIDGSGKSTVAEWIAQHYASLGETVRVQHHPSDGLMGRLSARSLRGEGKIMYMLSSMFYMIDVLFSVIRLPVWKGRYDNVVFVRYLLATAYLPENVSRTAYDLFVRVLPVPKRLLLVDVEPECALHRIAQREHEEEMFENLPSLIEVRDKVLSLARTWTVLDNNGCETESRQRLDDILAAWDD